MADQVWLPSLYVFKKGFRVSFDVFVFEGLIGPALVGLLSKCEARMRIACYDLDFFKSIDAPFFPVFLYLDEVMRSSIKREHRQSFTPFRKRREVLIHFQVLRTVVRTVR